MHFDTQERPGPGARPRWGRWRRWACRVLPRWGGRCRRRAPGGAGRGAARRKRGALSEAGAGGATRRGGGGAAGGRCTWWTRAPASRRGHPPGGGGAAPPGRRGGRRWWWSSTTWTIFATADWVRSLGPGAGPAGRETSPRARRPKVALGDSPDRAGAGRGPQPGTAAPAAGEERSPLHEITRGARPRAQPEEEVSCTIPHRALTVVTGPSGSGKVVAGVRRDLPPRGKAPLHGT